MADGSIARARLWREGLKGFRNNWREWLYIAAIFFFILIVINGLSIHYVDPLQSEMNSLKTQKDPKAILAFFSQNGWLLSSSFVVMFLVILSQQYLFLSFFLQKELGTLVEKPSVRDFFCYASKSVQLILILMAWGLLASLAAGGVFVLAGILKLQPLRWLAFLIFVVAFGGLFYIAMRYYLTTTLAAGKIKAPLRTSWALTRGHFWRLFGNTVILFLFFLALYLFLVITGLLLGLIFTLIGKIWFPEAEDILTLFFHYVMVNVIQVIAAGISASYVAATCRILYQEKLQTDPTFALTRRR